MIARRTVLAGLAASAIARPSLAQGGSKTLRFIPMSDLASLDPVWTTANITRHHAFMIYDTLFGLDSNFEPRPQMAAGYSIEDDGRSCTITLRDGLKFHDGAPVRAQDAIASLKRWMRRNSGGQFIAANTDDLLVVNDKVFRFKLKRPQPGLIALLASITAPVAFIMPEGAASTDAFTQIRTTIGSGPFKFKADEYSVGNQIVYEKNTDYVPSSDGARGLTAGPKIAFYNRVEWRIIPDAGTASAAMQTGEADWYESPPPELIDLFKTKSNFSVEKMDMLPAPALLRFNHLHPPFNDPKLRQAVLPALAQSDYMAAAAGDDREYYVDQCGYFTPGTPMASTAGLEAITSPRSVDRAKELIRAAGYMSPPKMRLLSPTDSNATGAISLVGADMFRRIGFDVDVVSADWATVVQRRASREPLEKGGWSIFPTTVNSPDFMDPAIHFALRGNGTDAWLGWPSSPRLESLRERWFAAPDLAVQKKVAEDIQRVAFEDVPYLPVGAYNSRTVLRADLKDRVLGFPIFWNLKAG